MWYRQRFTEALAAAGIEGRVRTFHDMRHTALTNLALTPQASELVLMTTAGHRSFATTKQYSNSRAASSLMPPRRYKIAF